MNKKKIAQEQKNISVSYSKHLSKGGTNREFQVYAIGVRFWNDNKVPFRNADIRGAMGFHRTAATLHLRNLVKKGFLKRVGNKAYIPVQI